METSHGRQAVALAGWLLLLVICAGFCGIIGSHIFAGEPVRPIFEGVLGLVLFVVSIPLGIYSFWRILRTIHPSAS